MDIETIVERYPKETEASGLKVFLRPLQPTDVRIFHEFVCAVPETERMFLKHRITDIDVIHAWCKCVDYSRHLPLLVLAGNKIIANATLHQRQGGWKRHIGLVSVVVHPEYRGLGFGRLAAAETIEVARNLALERLEAEFIGEQKTARQLFATLGFDEIVVIHDYVKDMHATAHDYVLMGRSILTDEEFTSQG